MENASGVKKLTIKKQLVDTGRPFFWEIYSVIGDIGIRLRNIGKHIPSTVPVIETKLRESVKRFARTNSVWNSSRQMNKNFLSISST
jgi:hypothetical protein